MDFRKLSQYAFFAFLFFLPFQTVLLLRESIIDGAKWQYGIIGIYLSDIILVLAIISAVVTNQFYKKIFDFRFSIFERKSWALTLKSSIKNYCVSEATLALLVLWSGLSIFWAADHALAGYSFVKLVLAAGVFFIARSLNDADTRTAMRIFFAAAVLQSMIGIWQFLSQSSFASILFGMSVHESWTAGTSVLKLESGRFLRAYGSFPHPNLLGGYLATASILSISYFVSYIKKQQSLPLFFVLHSSFLILLLGLILTFSRTSWVGLTLGVVAYLVFCIKHHIWRKCGMRIFAVVGIAVTVFIFVLRDQVFPRFDMGVVAREESISERMLSLADAKDLIVAHPIAGVGVGNFTAVMITDYPNRPIWIIQPAHNVFVLVLSELGAVGLILFFVFITALLKDVILGLGPGIQRALWRLDSCFRGNDKEEHFFSKNQNAIFAIALFTLFPSLLLDHWLWSSHFGVLFLFLLAGFSARK